MTTVADDFTALSEAIGQWLAARHWKLATAESCTGGGVAELITATAGSSGWFDCGFVTYSNESKQRLLGVSERTLAAHGAVSEATAREMVTGALARSQAQLALAVSGIAGPGGGSSDKPVGTVCFAWGLKNGIAMSETRLFSGNRQSIRHNAVRHALSAMMAQDWATGN
jgi:nicotinamide-nucleotide amidase